MSSNFQCEMSVNVTSLLNRDLIRILLQSRRFDFETLLLSEGDPSNEALEVKESVEVSEAVEVNKARKDTGTGNGNRILAEKKIQTTTPSEKSTPAPQLGSSEGHYRELQ